MRVKTREKRKTQLNPVAKTVANVGKVEKVTCKCTICCAEATGDQEIIDAAYDAALANGEAFEMTPEQLAYFVDHLKPEWRRDYDAIKEAEGLAPAFAFTLQRALRETIPNFTVNQPARRLQ